MGYKSKKPLALILAFIIHRVHSLNITSSDDDHLRDSESIEAFCRSLDIPKLNFSCQVADRYEEKVCCDYLKTMRLIKPIPATVYVTLISSIVGLIGNVAVVTVALKNYKDLTRCHILFAHLAFVDFTFAVIQIVICIPLIWTTQWIYGIFFCKVLYSGFELGSLISVGLILLVAIERAFGILFPLKYNTLSKNALRFSILSNIVVAAISTIPLLLYIDINEYTGVCMMSWHLGSTKFAIYHWYLLICYALVPMVTIACLYSQVIRALKEQAKNAGSLLGRSEVTKRVKQNRKIMWKIIAIMVVFMICTIPYRIVVMYLHYKSSSIDRSKLELLYILQLSYPFHVTFNPIIYNAIDSRWRKDMLHIISCCQRRRYLDNESDYETVFKSVSDYSIHSRNKLLSGLKSTRV